MPKLSELSILFLSEKRKLIDKFKKSYTYTADIFSINNTIFVLYQLEQKNWPETDHRMEIYNVNGAHILANIHCPYFFLDVTPNGDIYFLIDEEVTDENTFYTVGIFKLGEGIFK
jgi:hypothetical protein